MQNIFLSLIYSIYDFPFKLIDKVKSLISSKEYSLDRSDSELTGYVKLVKKSISNQARFRSYYGYRRILEHVSYSQGLSYVNRIRKLAMLSSFELQTLPGLDRIGKPRVFNYTKLGKMSPTTLRYFSVASEIRSLFGNNIGQNIVEIGAGFGGQALVLDQLFSLKSITIFDLPEVNLLISKFFSNFDMKAQVVFKTMPEVSNNKVDFVLSNYAFSELPSTLQFSYLSKIIASSPRGYMIMNSGRSNETGRSVGKISLAQLQSKIPGLAVSEEIPKTGPDNYVVHWGTATDTSQNFK